MVCDQGRCPADGDAGLTRQLDKFLVAHNLPFGLQKEHVSHMDLMVAIHNKLVG